jgi:hypothetical protein
MALPLAYYLTWTTYGAWLPGDRRGWVSKHDAAYITPIKEPDPATEEAAREKMRSIPVRFDREKRRMVDAMQCVGFVSTKVGFCTNWRFAPTTST